MKHSEPDPISSLDYVRMCAEVSGWVQDAADEDERERLVILANHYGRLAQRVAEQERSALLGNIRSDLREYLERQTPSLPDRPYSEIELEHVRALNAVTPIGQLDLLRADEMYDLADLMEGWAQTRHLHPVTAARFFGLADGLRNIAEAVGPGWQPSSSTGSSFSSALVRWMRDPEI